MPSFVSSGFIIVACDLPVKIFNDVAASGFTSGMLLGYAAYMFIHHATHHFAIQPGDWLYKARRMSTPASRRWVAKLCRNVCAVTGLSILACFRALRQASCKAPVLT